MHKLQNRHQLYLNEPDIIGSISLNDEIMYYLANDECFNQYYSKLEEFSNKREKIIYILWVMSREQYTLKRLIDYLEKARQSEAATKLKAISIPEQPWTIDWDNIDIGLYKVIAPKQHSGCFPMDQYPRGTWFIINNVEDQQVPDYLDVWGNVIGPKGLQNETKRFKYIFEELYFNVKVLRNKTAVQIKDELTDISKNNCLDKNQAFVLIMISHGQDEQVYGYKACETNRKISFNRNTSQSDINEAQQDINKDLININDITEIFQQDNCPKLRLKPKLYFYICCRTKTDHLNPVTVSEPKKTFDTFVNFACAEGYEKFYRLDKGMTYFGQALTHSIGQYAVDQPLDGLMDRTSTRLRQMYADHRRDQLNYGLQPGERKVELGSYVPTYTKIGLTQALYFNPGWPKTYNTKPNLKKVKTESLI